VTVTLELFHPAEFGAGATEAEIVGGTVSVVKVLRNRGGKNCQTGQQRSIEWCERRLVAPAELPSPAKWPIVSKAVWFTPIHSQHKF